MSKKFEKAIQYCLNCTGRIFLQKLSSNLPVLIVEFSGQYGCGSKGNDDSRFMTEVIKLAVNSWNSSGLILDLSNLSYQWGNSIGNVFWAGKLEIGDSYPTAVVVSDSCKEAVENLLRSCCPEFKEDQWIFDNHESALNHIEKEINSTHHTA